jgi:hypothetical protein
MSIKSRDENFSFLIVNEKSTNHVNKLVLRMKRKRKYKNEAFFFKKKTHKTTQLRRGAKMLFRAKKLKVAKQHVLLFVLHLNKKHLLVDALYLNITLYKSIKK